MDEVLAVNGQDVCSMDHAAILALIKNSGTAVKLTVQQPKSKLRGSQFHTTCRNAYERDQDF